MFNLPQQVLHSWGLWKPHMYTMRRRSDTKMQILSLPFVWRRDATGARNYNPDDWIKCSHICHVQGAVRSLHLLRTMETSTCACKPLCADVTSWKGSRPTSHEPAAPYIKCSNLPQHVFTSPDDVWKPHMHTCRWSKVSRRGSSTCESGCEDWWKEASCGKRKQTKPRWTCTTRNFRAWKWFWFTTGNATN